MNSWALSQFVFDRSLRFRSQVSMIIDLVAVSVMLELSVFPQLVHVCCRSTAGCFPPSAFIHELRTASPAPRTKNCPRGCIPRKDKGLVPNTVLRTKNRYEGKCLSRNATLLRKSLSFSVPGLCSRAILLSSYVTVVNCSSSFVKQ